MIKYVLLGLLARQSRYGYELKSLFEDLLGGTWPLNPGQVYMTLSRLEAEELVTSEVVPQELLPDRRVYSLTEEGRRQLKQWTAEPAEGPIRLREELFVKVLTSALLDDGDQPVSLVWAQRDRHLRALARLTELRAEPSLPFATALMLDGAILRAEADLKWLDLCEERLQEEGKG